MREGETDYKGKFWVGQRVKILNLPPADDIICDTGVIKGISTRFERMPELRANSYDVRIDGSEGMFKMKIVQRVYIYGSNGDNLEPIVE